MENAPHIEHQNKENNMSETKVSIEFFHTPAQCTRRGPSQDVCEIGSITCEACNRNLHTDQLNSVVICSSMEPDLDKEMLTKRFYEILDSRGGKSNLELAKLLTDRLVTLKLLY